MGDDAADATDDNANDVAGATANDFATVANDFATTANDFATTASTHAADAATDCTSSATTTYLLRHLLMGRPRVVTGCTAARSSCEAAC